MADIIVREGGEGSDKEALAKAAHNTFEIIKTLKGNLAMDYLALGFHLKVARDEKHYVVLGHESFDSYLGDPDIAFSRSWAFDVIRLYEVYVLRLKREEGELTTIGPAKLLMVAKDDPSGQPLVTKDPDEWMGLARSLSRSDLKDEVDAALGKVKPEKAEEAKVDQTIPWTPDGSYYHDLVKRHDCIVCGAKSTKERPTDPAHFPVTKAAGGEKVKDWVIPLCRKCHDEYHADPVKWTRTYQHKWAGWFYSIIFGAIVPPDPPEEEIAMETQTVVDPSPHTDPPAIAPETPEKHGGNRKKRALQRPVPTPEEAAVEVEEVNPASYGAAVEMKRCPVCKFITHPDDLNEDGVCKSCA